MSNENLIEEETIRKNTKSMMSKGAKQYYSDNKCSNTNMTPTKTPMCSAETMKAFLQGQPLNWKELNNNHEKSTKETGGCKTCNCKIVRIACSFCDHMTCETCLRRCDKCDGIFCSLCALPRYISEVDTAICFSCVGS